MESLLTATDIVGSLWEYGALIVIESIAVYLLWKRVNYLQDQLINLIKDYTDALHDLTDLIKGDHHNDDT